ncbi:MAG: thioredoxin family protein [Verrucomicrobia bacterium]|nr:thioredoxin family protein [Verrucomicrobiota bacterium]
MTTNRHRKASARQAFILAIVCCAAVYLWSWVTEPVPAELPWASGLDSARAAAKAQRRPLLLYFTGSTWCSSCMKFNRRVLSTEPFASFATNRMLFVKLDFPDPAIVNPGPSDLLEARMREYKVSGFPTIVLMSPDGLELGRAIGPDFYDPSDLSRWVIDRTESRKKTQD